MSGRYNRRFWMKRSLLGALIFGLGLSVPLSAGAADSAAWKSQFFAGFQFQGETDLEKGGDFEFWMVELGLSSSRMLNDSWSLTLTGDYRAVGYNFNGFVGDPWEDVHVLRLRPTLTYHFNETWSLMSGLSGEFSGEGGADFGDALRGGGLLGLGYRSSDRFSIVLGAVVQSEIEDDVYVQPLVLVNWGITDALRLSMEGTNTRGGEVRLGYSFNDNWKLGVGAGYRRERFRLNDDAPANRVDGVGEEEATVVTARVTYTFDGGTAIELYGGTTVDGEFKLETESGSTIRKADYDDSGFGGILIKFPL